MNFKNKKELTFSAIGILMLIIVSVYSAMAIRFLVKELNQILNRKSETSGKVLHFQIEKAEKAVENR